MTDNGDWTLAIDKALQTRLDRASPDDPMDVIVVLDSSAVTTDFQPVDPADIKGGRDRFAREASRTLTGIVDDAARRCRQSAADVEIFDRLASARLRAPAKMVAFLGSHPSVASIRLTSPDTEKN